MGRHLADIIPNSVRLLSAVSIHPGGGAIRPLSEVSLRRVGIQPFGKILTTRKSFSGGAEGTEIDIDIDCVHFDLRYAEAAAVSDLLFWRLKEAPGALHVTLAEF